MVETGDEKKTTQDRDIAKEKRPVDHDYKKKAIEASSFVIIGFGLSQVIRLGSNIILTRLLAPELFGIVSLARVFMTGLYLFSDIGLGPAIVRSRRSDDPVFLNTAWTIQIIRNMVLFIISCIIAIPIASIYKQPILIGLIPAIGFSGIFNGFHSTSLISLDRDLQQKKLAIVELTTQIISLSCMILAAYFFRSVWTLLISEIISSLLKLTWSHSINNVHPNKFVLEKNSTKEILSFGKWILISTAMMFLASQADRILLGKLFTMEVFGVYNTAALLAELPKQIVERLGGKVIFPLITKYSHLPREELREKIRRPRGKILSALALLLALFVCFGDLLIQILYDERYTAAAWILPMLALGMWPLLLCSTIDGSLLAIGKPRYSAIRSIAKFIFMIVSIPIAFKIGGPFGTILIVALNDIPQYLVLSYGLIKEKLALLRQDAFTTAVLFIAIAFFLGIRTLLGMGIPGYAAYFLNS